MDSKLEEDIAIDEKPVEPDSTGLSTDNLSPVSAGNEPMECSSSLTSQTSPKEDLAKMLVGANEDVVMAESAAGGEINVCSLNNFCQIIYVIFSLTNLRIQCKLRVRPLHPYHQQK